MRWPGVVRPMCKLSSSLPAAARTCRSRSTRGGLRDTEASGARAAATRLVTSACVEGAAFLILCEHRVSTFERAKLAARRRGVQSAKHSCHDSVHASQLSGHAQVASARPRLARALTSSRRHRPWGLQAAGRGLSRERDQVLPAEVRVRVSQAPLKWTQTCCMSEICAATNVESMFSMLPSSAFTPTGKPSIRP